MLALKMRVVFTLILTTAVVTSALHWQCEGCIKQLARVLNCVIFVCAAGSCVATTLNKCSRDLDLDSCRDHLSVTLTVRGLATAAWYKKSFISLPHLHFSWDFVAFVGLGNLYLVDQLSHQVLIKWCTVLRD